MRTREPVSTPAGIRSVAVRSAIERYAAVLDQYCRSDPYNWFNFYDFWRTESLGVDILPRHE